MLSPEFFLKVNGKTPEQTSLTGYRSLEPGQTLSELFHLVLPDEEPISYYIRVTGAGRPGSYQIQAGDKVTFTAVAMSSITNGG